MTKGRFPNGTVKVGIGALKLFGEDHHIPMVRLRDKRDPFGLIEIPRLGKGDPDPILQASDTTSAPLAIRSCPASAINLPHTFCTLFINRLRRLARCPRF